MDKDNAMQMLKELEVATYRDHLANLGRPYSPEPLTDEEATGLAQVHGVPLYVIRDVDEAVVEVAEEHELNDAEGRIVWGAVVLGIAMPTMRYKWLSEDSKARVDAARDAVADRLMEREE